MMMQGEGLMDIKASQLIMSKASLIGNLSQHLADGSSGIWQVFDYVKAFSYVAQLAVERIPLEEKNKAD